MIEVRLTVRFVAWLTALRDSQGRARILKRIERARGGNLGDVAPVGEGVSEMRLFFGPGYRLYFTLVEGAVVVLLSGGDKSTQADDIAKAKQLAREVRDGQG